MSDTVSRLFFQSDGILEEMVVSKIGDVFTRYSAIVSDDDMDVVETNDTKDTAIVETGQEGPSTNVPMETLHII